MKTRVNTASFGNFFETFIYLSLIALVAAFFALFQVQQTYYPAGHHHRSTTVTRFSAFRGLVRLPEFRFTQSAAEDAVSLASEEEAKLGPQAMLDRWQPIVKEASERFALPESWIRAVIRTETGGRTTLAGKPITSAVGAMGVMQLMSGTYDEMRDRYGLGDDPHNARDNIMAGTAYLRELYKQYGYPYLFAAYNAGPGRLEAFLHRQKSLPPETRNYVRLATDGAVNASFGQVKAAAAAKKATKLAAAKKTRVASAATRVAAIYQPAS